MGRMMNGRAVRSVSASDLALYLGGYVRCGPSCVSIVHITRCVSGSMGGSRKHGLFRRCCLGRSQGQG